jgi:hypothetical protein
MPTPEEIDSELASTIREVIGRDLPDYELVSVENRHARSRTTEPADRVLGGKAVSSPDLQTMQKHFANLTSGRAPRQIPTWNEHRSTRTKPDPDLVQARVRATGPIGAKIDEITVTISLRHRRVIGL